MKALLTILFVMLFLPLQAQQKPPVTDYCEMLERDIQGKMYSFIAGNHMYYIGGKVNEYWEPVYSETIGFLTQCSEMAGLAVTA